MMRKLLIFLLLLIFNPVMAGSNACQKWPSWFQSVCSHLDKVWTEGDNELYLSGYAWHNRYTYSRQKIRSFNENAWGGGFGRGLYNAKGNLSSIYAIAFMDSHDHVQPLIGYAYQKYFPLSTNTKIGLGISAFITSRVDINHSFPIPGVLPIVSLTHKKITLSASYIPSAKGAGNVLFLIGKYTFLNT